MSNKQTLQDLALYAQVFRPYFQDLEHPHLAFAQACSRYIEVLPMVPCCCIHEAHQVNPKPSDSPCMGTGTKGKAEARKATVIRGLLGCAGLPPSACLPSSGNFMVYHIEAFRALLQSIPEGLIEGGDVESWLVGMVGKPTIARHGCGCEQCLMHLALSPVDDNWQDRYYHETRKRECTTPARLVDFQNFCANLPPGTQI